jgi:hypothetical protein
VVKVFSIIHLVIGCMWIAAGVAFKWSLLEWINNTFLIGISALGIIVVMHIWHTGSIDRLIEGFRLLGRAITPKTRSQLWADQQIDADEVLSFHKEMSILWMRRILIGFAITSLAISVLGLCVYQIVGDTFVL